VHAQSSKRYPSESVSEVDPLADALYWCKTVGTDEQLDGGYKTSILWCSTQKGGVSRPVFAEPNCFEIVLDLGSISVACSNSSLSCCLELFWMRRMKNVGEDESALLDLRSGRFHD
jgi:hypothetical protein